MRSNDKNWDKLVIEHKLGMFSIVTSKKGKVTRTHNCHEIDSFEHHANKMIIRKLRKLREGYEKWHAPPTKVGGFRQGDPKL